MPLDFEWDQAKASANLRKHGVSFEEAATVFADELSLAIPDPDHSRVEERFILLGTSYRGKMLVVVHTERGDSVRIISARPARRRERQQYEEAN
ncbi:MAG: BrnT family toxin [Verrucomicrobia bacterium]|nr:BrnT family toxin [Verrucomicrobiota bacterium]